MKVLVVDDHAIVRSGLRRLMQPAADYKVLEAATGHEAIMAFRSERPDMALVDVNLPDIGGFEVLRRILAEDAHAHVLMFSMHAEAIYATQALREGALGYISKSASPEEILDAINHVAEGEGYVEQRLAQEMVLRHMPGRGEQDVLQSLKARELEMLRLLGEGRSLNQISDAMGVSYKTTANSLSMLKAKLGISTTTELVRMAIKSGISP